ncbi:myelin protein zero-like protein 3 isoform 3-T3 [Clarias gariepinus]
MMKCLYLVFVVFHVAAGCAFSDNKEIHIYGHRGDSVLLPCSCSDLSSKPQRLTWWTYRTGSATKVLNDQHYRNRVQLFNNISPANLSLLISNLRVEDDADYSCSTEKDHRDIRLHVKGSRETSTHWIKSDTTVFSILVVLLLVISGVVAITCWKCRERRSKEDVITEGCPDSNRMQKDQTVYDVTYSTVTHINTPGAARVQINTEKEIEYAIIIAN